MLGEYFRYDCGQFTHGVPARGGYPAPASSLTVEALGALRSSTTEQATEVLHLAQDLHEAIAADALASMCLHVRACACMCVHAHGVCVHV